MPDTQQEPQKQPRRHKWRSGDTDTCGTWCLECKLFDRILPTAFLFGVLLCLLYYITLAAPIDFPSAALMKVSPGETAADVAVRLSQKHIIRSQYLFDVFTRIYDDGKVVPGEYFFPGPQAVFTIARRLSHGDFELIPVRVTIPEGANTSQVSQLLAQKLADFDNSAFLKLASPKEGYLFPDTYFFLPGEEPTVVIASMETNFKNKIGSIASTTTGSGKPLADLLVMASLLEKEASDTHSRRIISGILWHRIAIGMRLQVDAVFPYIIGKNSLQLTRSDLKVDSPYNTYKYKGLPPGPITNPGLDSILAAATPIKTNYLYYLSDLHGNFHFSTTYAQQLANQRKYLP